MNQSYIQVINLACIIYLIYLTLRISRNNILKDLKPQKEESLNIVDTIREVLKEELKDIGDSESQSRQKIDGLSENSDQVSTVNQGESSDVEDDIINWIKEIMGKGMRHFSQNDEDGAIEAIFDRIGTKDKIYVEFGVEDCTECNTRYLREKKGWDVKKSLLLDGGNENKEINLFKEIFWPDNIISLFKKYKVKKEFDLLSVDTDSYDFFMLETILEAGYSPRVIVVEYNANFEISEARSIMPPGEDGDWQRGTARHIRACLCWLPCACWQGSPTPLSGQTESI